MDELIRKEKNIDVHCDNSTLHKEFNLFEVTHKRSYNLEIAYNVLLTICLVLRLKEHLVQLDFFFIKFRTGVTLSFRWNNFLKKLLNVTKITINVQLK